MVGDLLYEKHGKIGTQDYSILQPGDAAIQPAGQRGILGVRYEFFQNSGNRAVIHLTLRQLTGIRNLSAKNRSAPLRLKTFKAWDMKFQIFLD